MKQSNARKKNQKIPLFSVQYRLLAVVAVFAVMVGLLAAYNHNSLRNSMEIESGDELSGQRIACCVGWEADYLLSPRKDINLRRYDSNADCLLSLSYGQVDALALDEITMHTVLMKTEGLEVLPNPITSVGCTFYASYAAEDKLAQFNEFAERFTKSAEYQSYHDAVFEDDYHMADIPEISYGEKLVVGYIPECYPESYLDFATGEPAGYGIEMIKRFAYEYGYTIEWVETSDTAAIVQLSLNQLDFAASYITDVYRIDTENSGNAHMTEPYFYADVYLVKIKDGEKLVITGEIDT